MDWISGNVNDGLSSLIACLLSLAKITKVLRLRRGARGLVLCLWTMRGFLEGLDEDLFLVTLVNFEFGDDEIRLV